LGRVPRGRYCRAPVCDARRVKARLRNPNRGASRLRSWKKKKVCTQGLVPGRDRISRVRHPKIRARANLRCPGFDRTSKLEPRSCQGWQVY
jgi:hypothetical protein